MNRRFSRIRAILAYWDSINPIKQRGLALYASEAHLIKMLEDTML